ncbi:MAG: NAD(P)-binding domain-containing protein [Clostridiales bacterium]|nr:NAD(P)-binding domain-containing protein [Clostridiales bacterium]
MKQINELPTIGILGVGVIGSALARGFATCQIAYPLLLSSLDQTNMVELAASYPKRIRLASDNQQVLDEADWLILALPPAKGEEILLNLSFSPRHKVINLLADKSLEQIAAWIGSTALLAHMVPLPFVARHLGPIVIYPHLEELARLMAPLGQVVAAQTPHEVHVLQAITALMAPFDTLLAEIVCWAGANGVEEMPAKAYTVAFFGAICQQVAEVPSGRLRELADEMTPGGLNAMAKDHINQHNAFKPWVAALDPVMERLGN